MVAVTWSALAKMLEEMGENGSTEEIAAWFFAAADMVKEAHL